LFSNKNRTRGTETVAGQATPIKRQRIASELRAKIVLGELPPNARMPTRRELSRQYAGTLTTVQHAISSLERDGFVVSRGKLGTFVVDRPPHLNRMALAFPATPGNANWGLYWDHLAAAARHVVTDQGLHLSVYTGIDAREPGDDYQHLLDDVLHDRVAGIIFSTSPFTVAGTPILDRPGIPRVVLAEPSGPTETLGHVVIDSQDFARKAVGFLQEHDVQRPAILGSTYNAMAPLLTELAAAGITCPYHLQHGVSLATPEWAKHITRLLFADANGLPPDALVVLDDNLFEHALAGILDAGRRIPDDLQLLTHSNFPWQFACPVAATRLGYDMHELLALFIAELQAQRAGQPPQTRTLKAVFERDLPPRRATAGTPATFN
jgi:DNA-binding LacI/PurR family transcriptional regulator